MERFRVRAGKEARAREWIAFLRENPEAFRETLEPERMYVETIFSETVGDALYLWWYTLQGEDGAELSDSTHCLDERHAVYWRECIDPDEPSLLLTPEVHMSPERLEDAMRPLGSEAGAQNPAYSRSVSPAG